jgi:hypothetical protein
MTGPEKKTPRHPYYVPVPPSVTLCGLPPPLSSMVTNADLAPVFVGMKYTVILQLPPGETVAPQVLLMEKSPGSEPVAPMLVMVRVEAPTFVSITTLGGLIVPTFCAPRFSPWAESLTIVPVPESETV